MILQVRTGKCVSDTYKKITILVVILLMFSSLSALFIFSDGETYSTATGTKYTVVLNSNENQWSSDNTCTEKELYIHLGETKKLTALGDKEKRICISNDVKLEGNVVTAIKTDGKTLNLADGTYDITIDGKNYILTANIYSENRYILDGTPTTTENIKLFANMYFAGWSFNKAVGLNSRDDSSQSLVYFDQDYITMNSSMADRCENNTLTLYGIWGVKELFGSAANSDTIYTILDAYKEIYEPGNVTDNIKPYLIAELHGNSTLYDNKAVDLDNQKQCFKGPTSTNGIIVEDYVYGCSIIGTSNTDYLNIAYNLRLYAHLAINDVILKPYSSSILEKQIMAYCNGYDFTVGSGVLLSGFKEANNSNRGNEVTVFDTSIMSGTYGSSKPDGGYSNIVTVNGGEWGRIISGNRSGNCGSVGTSMETVINFGYKAAADMVCGGQTEGTYYADSTVNINGGQVFRVIGGTLGNNKNNYEDNYFYGNVLINISEGPGECKSTVYNISGGSMGRNMTNVHQIGDVCINIFGGNIGGDWTGQQSNFTEGHGKYSQSSTEDGCIWGGSLAGTLCGDIRINISGGTIHKGIFGAGAGKSSLCDETSCKNTLDKVSGGDRNVLGYKLGYTSGDVSIIIGDGGTPELKGNVYGGGQGFKYTTFSGADGKTTIAELNGNTSVKIFGFSGNKDIFGGGKGIACDTETDYDKYGDVAKIIGNTSVKCVGGTVNNLYGGAKSSTISEVKLPVGTYTVHIENRDYTITVSDDGTVNLELDGVSQTLPAGIYGAIPTYAICGSDSGIYFGSAEAPIIIPDMHIISYNGNTYFAECKSDGKYNLIRGSKTISSIDAPSSVKEEMTYAITSHGDGKYSVSSGTYAVLESGTVNRSVYGGSYGGTVTADGTSILPNYVSIPTTVTIYDGTVLGNVYGGSYEGTDGNSEDLRTSSLDIYGGKIMGDVFGGGFKGIQYGGTVLNIGYEGSDETVKYGDLRIVGSVFCGVNMGSANTDAGVKMYGEVIFNVNGSNYINVGVFSGSQFIQRYMELGGSLSCGGKSSSVSGSLTMNLIGVNPSDGENSINIRSIQVADVVTFKDCNIVLEAESDMTSVFTSNTYSIAHIGKLILDGSDQGNTISFMTGIYDVADVLSTGLNSDGSVSTNKIVSMGGTPFVFGETDAGGEVVRYGHIHGPVKLVTSIDSEGTYVMAARDAGNHGHFYNKDGTEIPFSDTSASEDYSEGLRYWRFGGTNNIMNVSISTSESDSSAVLTLPPHTQSTKYTIHGFDG